MQHLYKITMPNNSTIYVTASDRISAIFQLTGMRPDEALKSGQIKDIKLFG